MFEISFKGGTFFLTRPGPEVTSVPAKDKNGMKLTTRQKIEDDLQVP